MNKAEIAAYFDAMAPTWDDHMVTNNSKLKVILDAAGVKNGVSVLDVACGTGVLFPYYLTRGVSRVIGVDISPEMCRIAVTKLPDSRIEVICGDVETVPVHRQCDCCVVYNAFPHFSDPTRLISALARWVRPGGRLTVAHGMSLAALRAHHRGRAEHISREMLEPGALAERMLPWFAADILISDQEKYIVTGIRRDTQDPFTNKEETENG